MELTLEDLKSLTQEELNQINYMLSQAKSSIKQLKIDAKQRALAAAISFPLTSRPLSAEHVAAEAEVYYQWLIKDI